MNRPLALTAAAVLTVSWLALAVSPAYAQRSADDDLQRWNRALDTLATNGMQHIEEIELTLTGRFDVEAANAERVEHDLKLSKDGTQVLASRSDGDIEDVTEHLSLDQVRAALGWLRSGGYRNLSEISADDGLLEIQADNAEGRKVELTLKPGTHELIEMEFERRLSLN